MAILNPEHLFQQAERLIEAPAAGPPRQVDLRRAVSSAYYGVFHYILSTAADQVVGATKRQSRLYSLVYRSIDHRALRDLCSETRKPQPGAKYQKYEPSGGFGPDLQSFARTFMDLQEKRYAADYDPSVRLTTSDASFTIVTARSAIQRFAREVSERREAFVVLLMFPPR